MLTHKKFLCREIAENCVRNMSVTGVIAQTLERSVRLIIAEYFKPQGLGVMEAIWAMICFSLR
jgi:hypothetical protein